MHCRSPRSGYLHPSKSDDLTVNTFVPAKLPPSPPLIVDAEMWDCLLRIYKGLGQLEAYGETNENADTLLRSLTRKEALFSSQIEGLNVTFDDFFTQDAHGAVADLLANEEAITFALNALETTEDQPLSLELLRQTHKVLMKHHPGQSHDKAPGLFRTTQNWIGPKGSSLREASFIPPCPESMLEALEDLERYIHTNDELNPFIKAALIHYQFETIHPFSDGNGRLGRILVLLYLKQSGVLPKLLIAPSFFLKLNQGKYYERLNAVRTDGRYEAWVKFFLRAIETAINEALLTIHQLNTLHDQNKALLTQEAQSLRKDVLERWLALLQILEARPLIEISHVAKDLKLSYPTASKMVEDFVKLGLLQEMTGNARQRRFAYQAFLNLFRDERQ